MYIYICIHVYVLECTYVCVCIFMYIYICIHVYVVEYTYVCVCIFMYIYLCMYTRTFVNFDAHLICPPPHKIESKYVADVFQKCYIEYEVFPK